MTEQAPPHRRRQLHATEAATADVIDAVDEHREAFEAHAGTPATKQANDKIAPLQAAPSDTRQHNGLAVAPGKMARGAVFAVTHVDVIPPQRENAVGALKTLGEAMLLVFLVVHLWQFRFGPTEAQGYVAPLGNREVWDLWRVVVEVFKQPAWVLFYTVVMALLGLHLRHGFWSAFQSIGLLGPGLRPLAYSAGLAFAVIVAAGFLAFSIEPLVRLFQRRGLGRGWSTSIAFIIIGACILVLAIAVTRRPLTRVAVVAGGVSAAAVVVGPDVLGRVPEHDGGVSVRRQRLRVGDLL